MTRTLTVWPFMLVLLILFGCGQKNVDQYTCPMHASVLKDKPGDCPICGMHLVLRRDSATGFQDSTMMKKANVRGTVRMITPVKRSMTTSAKFNGVIAYDTRRQSAIASRVTGRIERLLIKYNFQPIHKGQKIMEVYSPDLIVAQRDVLYLLQSNKEDAQLAEAAKEKLRLLGATDAQINALVTSGSVANTFDVFSQVEGYIAEASAISRYSETPRATGGSEMDGGMKSSAVSAAAPSDLLTREGVYVTAGQELFKVVNTASVWAEFDVYQRDVPFVKTGSTIDVAAADGQTTVHAKVNLVQPFMKGEERFAKIRVDLDNAKGHYRIGQLITAVFPASTGEALWIPASARRDLGNREIIFQRVNGEYQPVVIHTGRHDGDWVEVVRGLQETDSIANHVQYISDSESFVKIKHNADQR